MADFCVPQGVNQNDGTQKSGYMQHTDVAKDGSSTHDQIVTTGKATDFVDVDVSTMGCGKFEVGTWDGVTYTVAATLVIRPGGDSNECCRVSFDEITGDATNAIRIIAYNFDAPTNFYSSMCWFEN